jgi:hypothetical protein
MEQGQQSEYIDWLLAVQSRVRILAVEISVIIPKTVQIVAGAKLATCSTGMKVLFWEEGESSWSLTSI